MSPRAAAVERLYRAALRVYPRRIRDVHGDEMAHMFMTEWARARAEGLLATLAIVARTVRDLAINGTVARARVIAGLDRGSAWRSGVEPREGMRMGIEALVQDLKHAMRGLRRAPAFTVIAVATLALGIGGNTAIYSIVDAAFFDPLPYPDDEELVVLYNSPRPDLGRGFAAFSAPFQIAIRDEGALTVGAIAPTVANVGGTDRPERVPGARVSASFFDVAAVPPVAGRAFGVDEDRPGAAPVAVLGHGLWTRRFAADPSVIGRTIVINDRPTTVTGVMPPGFEMILPDIEVWFPLPVDEAALDETSAVNNNRILVGRLPSGATPDEVEARMPGAVDRVMARFPGALEDNHAIGLVPLRRHLYGSTRSTLMILFAAVGVVLLIACANLANLLLVRAETTRQEMAVRAALGAGRGRLVRKLLTESLLVAVLGGGAGVLFAAVILSWVGPLAPANVPLPEAPAMDGTVLLFTGSLSLATGLLFGLLPAFSASGWQLRTTLAEGGRSGAGAGRSRARKLLIVTEVALTAVLLVGSGLLLRSLRELSAVDPGYGLADRTTVNIALPPGRYPDTEAMNAFYRELLAELGAVPGVTAAGLGQWLPLTNASNWGFEVEGQPEESVGFADYNLVTPGYLEAMGMEVVRGRDLTWADAAPEASQVMMISQAMANRLWPGEDPIGHRINIDLEQRVWREVVGVVSDVRSRSLEQEPGDLLYFPPTALPMSSPRVMSLVVHHAQGAAPVPEMRRIVATLNPAIPFTRLRTMEALAAASESHRRFVMTLLGMFAGIALALAAVGLYGVMSYTFSLRTREIGLRMAVGAGGHQVVGLVLRESVFLVAVGLAVGLAGAAAASRVLGSLLYGVSSTDVTTYAAVALFLCAISGLASWAPAARATRVDPVTVLRA